MISPCTCWGIENVLFIVLCFHTLAKSEHLFFSLTQVSKVSLLVQYSEQIPPSETTRLRSRKEKTTIDQIKATITNKCFAANKLLNIYCECVNGQSRSTVQSTVWSPVCSFYSNPFLVITDEHCMSATLANRLVFCTSLLSRQSQQGGGDY